MDDEKRKLYDEFGEIDDTLNINIDATYDYFRSIYPTITQKDIDSFCNKYLNSKMEEEDLIQFYNQEKGDLTNLLEYIPLSSNDDIQRYIQIYERLIKEKIIKKTLKFTNTKDKIKKLKEATKEAEEAKSKLDQLSSQIMLRHKERKNALDNLSKR